MNERTCQTCKHWTAPLTLEQIAARDGDDLEDVRVWVEQEDYADLQGFGRCAALESRGGALPPERSAVAWDIDRYHALFRCRADFGCTLWEPQA